MAKKQKNKNHQSHLAELRGDIISPKELQKNASVITWRIFRIMSEFVDDYELLGNIGKDVTVFGSARTKPEEKYYKVAEKLGQFLAKKKYTVITGGGPGIMEAANKGAYEAGGKSIGLNINLPSEQRLNPYVTGNLGFHFFFTRKVMLTTPSLAFVFFPGGFGTLDEFFEVATLIQTKKMPKVPLILVGKDYWEPLEEFA